MGRQRTGTTEWVPGKDGKPGHYKARITLDDGTRPWIHLEPGISPEMASEKAASKSEKATEKKATYTPKRGPRSHKPGSPMIQALSVEWITLLEQGDLAPATVSMHKSNVRNHILPAFGSRRPDELTSGVTRPWVRGLRKDLSPSTVHSVFNTMSKLIDDAMAEEWITLLANPTKHPAVRKELPSIEAPESIRYLTIDQAVGLVTAATTPADRRIRYLIAFLTGMRDGEISAIKWKSITAQEGVPVLYVERNLALIGPEGFATEGKPKTKASKRYQVIHSVLLAELEEWKAAGWKEHVGRDPKPEDYIVSDEDGAARRPRSAEFLRDDLEAAGLPTKFEDVPFEFRDTRHSFSTWLKKARVSSEDRDRLLGHAKKTVEQKHYGAADWQGLQRAVESIEFEGSPDDSIVRKSSLDNGAGKAEDGNMSKSFSSSAMPERSTFDPTDHCSSVASARTVRWPASAGSNDLPRWERTCPRTRRSDPAPGAASS